MPRPLLPFLIAGLLGAAPAAAQTTLPYPHLANMYWKTQVDSAVIQALAKWDVVVLNSVWTNPQLAQLRALNPTIKIFFYVNAYSVELPPGSNDPWKLEIYDHAQANDMWWYDKNQGVGSDWPGTKMANITDVGPVGPQGPWRSYIAGRFASLVQTHPDLDGLFMDNYWKQISWQQFARQLDSDCNPTHNPAGCNGVADTNAHLDSLWNAALWELAADVRSRFDVLAAQRGKPIGILTNNASDYFQYLNGTMIEYFPSGHNNVDYGNTHGYNWYEEMFGCPQGYMVAPFNTDPFEIRVLNATYPGSLWSPARNADFERYKRFALGSSLLGDGFMSLDAGVNGHGNLWWEPEYDHAGRGKGYLGMPLGPMYRILQPTGAEILANPGFTSGVTGWFGYPFGAPGSLSVDTSVYHTAPASARIDVTSVTSADGTYKLWQTPVPLTLDHTYTLSFWARASVPQLLKAEFYSDSCPNSRCLENKRYCLSTSWAQYEASFTSNGTAAAGLNFFVGVPGSVWIDDVSVREGDTGLFRRDFQHGAVIVNYTNTTRVASLGGTFWHLKVAGSSVWDGARVTQETVPISDARIVLADSTIDPPDSTHTAVPTHPGARYALRQNTPNPFNPQTEIVFSLMRSEQARLDIYDIAGRLVRTLVDRKLEAGRDQRVRWDGTDRAGLPVRSGIYLYRLTTPGFTQSRKMVVVR